ncbi:MAG: DUF4382 domain-containing protein [Bacteroidetes bacterium]|nr:DUF4382 domain-containing protein [Bacteroidota bacterium]
MLMVFFISCSDNNENNFTKVRVVLTDAPGDYEEVNIDVQEFRVNYTDSENDGWMTLDLDNPGVVNLLDLTGGVNLLLVDEDLPSGNLKQIRLVLGSNNTIVIDGNELPLNTPSAQQSGLKINVNYDLLAGVAYNITLDFDVDKSIVEAGNSGNYNLKPVIRATAEAQSGAISGSVTPFDAQVLVSAYDGIGGDTIRAFANSTGDFLLQGLSQGIYFVDIQPSVASGYQNVVVDNIQVYIGNVTDMGEIDIN